MSTEIPEHALIPFAPADLLGNRVLVIAPHPDDETFGCGGSLALHRRHGDPVTVIFLTSGEAGDWSGTSTPERTRMTREAEAGRALAELGVDTWEFWRLADRGVTVDGDLVERLTRALERTGPTLVYVPAPTDLNPDHRAAARAVRAAARGHAGPLAVAFVELSVPVPANTLVDVSPVWPVKERAMRAYPSQLAAAHDYAGVVTGLARFRSLTLDGATHVEAMRVVDASALDRDPIWRWSALQGPPAPTGAPEVSVVVRTRDRPAQLREALDSLAEQTFRDFEVVIVNDGGTDIADVVAGYPTLTTRHVRHAERLGRGAAVNTGVEHARGRFIAHLDDDDVFYPEHLAVLHDVLVRNPGFAVAYADVDVARFGWNDTTHRYQLIRRGLEYGRDFDADVLLYENYIPNVAVLHTREAFDRVGGFDTESDLIGDWDFLVRLSTEVSFVHVARRTAEYRVHFGGSLSTLRPWGMVDELRAREALFHRHQHRYTPEVQLRVFDGFKRRTIAAETALTEEAARAAQLEREVARLREELADARRPAPVVAPPPAPAAPPPPAHEVNGAPPAESNGGHPLDAAERRRLARVAGALRHPSRAARWAGVAARNPRLAADRLRGRR